VDAGEPTSLDELAQQVVRRAGSRPSARFVLGIAGPPGAGKSTLAARLRRRIADIAGSETVAIAPMDGFHLTNAELARRGWTDHKGEPHTFDVAAYVATLRQLRRSTAALTVPIYDRARHEPRPDGARFGPETSIVITEGNYLLLDTDGWSQVRDCLDEVWFLHAERALLAERLFARHVSGGKAAEVARRKVETSDLRNADLVASGLDRADLVLADDDGEYRLLESYGRAPGQ